LEECTQAVADYHSGKKQALSFLVGQVVRTTKGKANPTAMTELLEEAPRHPEEKRD